MELYAKGQLSYLILTCMQERDFYGLDIISEISNKSNGRINLKKPSVYSNLTRMEKQGYISSYLQNSDFGPNRKYYSLTEKGRCFYQELKSYFEKNNIDVFRDFQDFDEKEVQDGQISVTTNENIHEDFFDFSSLNDSVPPPITNNETLALKDKNEDKESELSIKSILSVNNTKENEEKNILEEVKIEEKKDDAVFLSTESVDDYNKRLYDISKDINKIKRKRSFADDQIAMIATDPLYLSNEKVKSNIQEFKNSILENREKFQENRTNSFDYFKQKEEIKSANINNSNTMNSSVVKQQKNEEVKDDARFITGRIDITQVEHAKKIEPPRLKIVSENTKDSRLPAPKRDKTIDPSHKEILNQLYSRTKDGSSNEVREDAIYDYNDLSDYYKSQGINFNVYQKSMDNTKHNTNKLYLVHSLVVFLVSALLSAALFVSFYFTGFTYGSTNFLYILLPALLLVDVGYKLYNFKNYSGWIPSQIKPQWQIWLLYILASLAVVGLNFALGLAVKPFYLFTTTLTLPLSLLIVLLPFRYFLKKMILVKYWR